MKTTYSQAILLLLLVFLAHPFDSNAQFPGCPDINAGADQTLPCSQNCTNLTATPFHTGLTNTYAVSSIPHTPPIAYNAPGGNAISVNIDDVWSPIINLPFNFCYYGTNYNTVKVGSNGAIKFGPTSSGGFHPWSYTANCPSAALSNAGNIFGVYHDIDPAVGGTVKWYVLGTAPCRIFVVSFNQLPHFLTSCNNLQSTHMMVLYETTNAIDVYINNKATCNAWNGGRAIVGIQNNTGTAGLSAPGRNATPTWTVTSPEGWRFTPNGAANYTVNWYQAGNLIGTGNTINVCPTATTTYTASVTYNRCDGTTITESDNVTVNYTSLPQPIVTPTAETCSNYDNGSVLFDNPAGSGPFNISIAGPSSDNQVEGNGNGASVTFDDLASGNYTYSITGNNGCTVTGNFTIGAGPQCCSVTAASTNPLCNGALTGTATATPVGLAPFSYSWTGGQTSQTASNLGIGNYTVTLTDASGCTSTATTTITQPTAVTGSATPTQVTCFGACNGSVSLTASGGVGPYQFRKNSEPYGANNVFSGLCAGTYTFTVKDANNCTFIINQTITQPTQLTLSLGTIVPATCGGNNGSAQIIRTGGTGTATFTIGGPTQTNGNFTNLAAGNYTATVTDANGCSQTIPFTIGTFSTPIASIINQQNVTCFGGVNGSALIGVAGGVGPYTYNVNGGAFQNSNAFNNLTPGTYNVIVRDANLCQSTISFTITAPTQLTYTTNVTQPSCLGMCNGQISFTPNGGVGPYQFSINNGISFSSTNPITNLCAGSYNVVVRDANLCLASSLITMTGPTGVSASFVNTNPICPGVCDGTSTVTATGGAGGYTYSFNGGAFQPSNVLSGLCGGQNTVIVEDMNGCQYSSIQTLIDPPTYNVNTIASTESNCGFNNGSATVGADGLNGPFLYSFDGGPFTVSNTFTNLFGGAYTIVAQDALGCQASSFIAISDVEMDGILISGTDATCFNSCDGEIVVSNVSGAPPITYEIDNAGFTQSSGTFPNLCEGNHAITIYDGGNCVFIVPYEINQPPLIMFETTVTDVLCQGGNSGTISFFNTTGGTGALEYSINNGTSFQSSPNFTGLTAGTYNLVVKDNNSCEVYGTATVEELPQLTFETGVDDLVCFNDNSGFLQIAASGGNGTYEYSIDNGANYSSIPAFISLAAGTYDISVRDGNMCTATGTATITEPTQLTLQTGATDALCFGSCDGEISFTAAGGTAPYQYSADGGLVFSVNPVVTGICAGTHNLLLIDDNGCSVSSTIDVFEPTQLSISITEMNATCSSSNGEISITASGGNGLYTYSIDNGISFVPSNTFTGLAANNYQIIVNDQNNCEATDLAVIDNEAAPSIIGMNTTDVTCNTACDGTLEVTVSGGTGIISYSIGGASQASGIFNNLCAGNYTATIIDENGCTDTEIVTITEPTLLTFTTSTIESLCFGQNLGQIDFNAIGGTAPYNYSIDNGTQFGSNDVVTNLPVGTYDLVVEDDNGCSANASITLTEPSELLITGQNVTDATCYDACDGVVSVTVSGGAGGESYVWSGGAVGGNSNTVNALCAASYDVEVTDANGCIVTEVLTVNQPGMLSITSVSATDVLCNADCNGTITIMAAGANEFSIDNGATFQSGSNFTGLCAGTYDIVVKNPAGCTQASTISINEPAPLINNPIPEDGMTICYDGYGTFSASATGGTQPYLFVWNTGDSTQYLNVNDTLPQTYTVIVTDINGCVSGPQSADVLIRPEFIASVTSPINVCPGAEAIAVASGVDGLPGYTYQWIDYSLDGSGNPEIDTLGNFVYDTLGTGDTYGYFPTQNETIFLVARDECYRYDTLEVQISLFTVPVPTINISPSIGCAPLDITMTHSLDPAIVSSAIWSISDGTSLNGNPSVNYQLAVVGIYDVILDITTNDGCPITSTFVNVVTVVPGPTADFSFNPLNPTNVNSTVNFTNESINGNEYSWNFGSYGMSSEENPTVNFSNIEAGDQIICLTVTSPEGCVDEVCKPVSFIEEFQIYVPNTFTPDGDAYNNEFAPVFPEGSQIDNYTLNVFNRWGEHVFESHNPKVGWDGNYGGTASQNGIYSWTIELNAGPELDKYKFVGHVNLMK